MPSYTIEQIMAAKSRFTEKPYPDFSIANVCRKLAPTALVRGEKAYVPRRATNADDAVRKTVQAALNKLNEENFDEISGELQCDMLLEPAAVKIFVALAFEKALNEPTFCPTYAKLCYCLARYEVQNAAVPPSSPSEQSPRATQSQFRSAIIERAQIEFNSKNGFVPPKDVSPEEVEQAFAAFSRRKKSNMKFVGQLYLTKVLSVNVMLSIIGELVGQPPHFPSDIDIEVLIELLEIIGARIEAQQPQFVSDVFDRFAQFLQKKPAYTPRIHFKIMDSIDLRANGWAVRDAASRPFPESTPASSKAPSTRATASKPTAPSPAVGTPTRKGQMTFPAAPASPAPAEKPAEKSWKNVVMAGKDKPAALNPQQTTTTTSAPVPQHKDPVPASKSSSNAASAFPSPQTLEKPPAAPKMTLDKAIDELFRTWGQDVTAPVVDWVSSLACYNLSKDVLLCEIITKVTAKACTTTKNYAQAEAAGFLACGLQLSIEDVIPGLAKTITNAIEEGIIEDTPKFPQRLVRVLEDFHRAKMAGKPFVESESAQLQAPLDQVSVTLMASDLAAILSVTLESLQDCDLLDDPVADALLPVWKKLPTDVPAEDESLTKAIIHHFAGSHPTKAVAAAEILAAARSTSLITGVAASKYMTTAPPAASVLVGLLEGKGFKKA